MLPKNYIKIRGQMISAPTASNETRAVGRWLAAAVYNRGAAPQLLPKANISLCVSKISHTVRCI